jgi:hypothetical protein
MSEQESTITEQRCPIWQTPAEIPIAESRRVKVNSARTGGWYEITHEALNSLNVQSDKEKVLVTCWLIEQRRLGVECPLIDSEALASAKQRRPWSVHERADYLLRYIDFRTDLLGTVVKFFELDNSKKPEQANELLAWTGSRQISEVITLAEYCMIEGWLEHRKTERPGTEKNTIHETMLVPKGYARLAILDGINSRSNQAFIAMWFDSTMDNAAVAIREGIRDAGYEPMRIDYKEHNEKIDDLIIAEIRRSRFLVADFTQSAEKGARGGVYYEAGFAHGLNLPVIFTCQERSLSFVHFDTRQYNHIVWNTVEDLRARLAQRISATIGDGPLKR